ncbi:3-oxoacyl-[acyl-carrier-protein] synthase [Cladochytrium tenue]|nr:3-oxoacyl-[acyl-carrier-protein] synthase [Cladochytrium tenue]
MFGLGLKRSDSALLHSLLSEPPALLASEAEAKTWIDSVVRSYAVKVGIAVGGGASSGSSGSSAAATVVTVNSEEFNLQRLKLDSLILFQLEQFAEYLDIDLMDGAKVAATEREGRAAIQPNLTSGARSTDSLQLYYGIVFGNITSVDRDLMNQCIYLMNRADDPESLITFMEFYINSCPIEKGENYARVQTLGKVLLDNCKEALKADPVFKNRYVKELQTGSSASTVTEESAKSVAAMFDTIRALLDEQKDVDGATKDKRSPSDSALWIFDAPLAEEYFKAIFSVTNDGISFKGKHILKALISDDARVIVTTSRFSKSVTQFYRGVYESCGFKGSYFVVVPFNGGSLILRRPVAR